MRLSETRVREFAHETERYAFEIRAASEKQKLTPSRESYVLAASSEDDRRAWISALRGAIHYSGGCFGRALSEQLRLERSSNGEQRSEIEVPLVVRRCLRYLSKHNAIEKDGIFRVGGRVRVQRELREEFDHGSDVDLDLVPECTVAEVSSLLKAYLQALPDTLIPARYFERVAPLGGQIQTLISQRDVANAASSASDREEDAERLSESFRRLKDTLQELPVENFNVLRTVMQYLSHVHAHADKNRMPATNIAITFWQVVLKPEDSTAELMESFADLSIRTVTVMIEHFDQLFDQETCDAVRKRSFGTPTNDHGNQRLSGGIRRHNVVMKSERVKVDVSSPVDRRIKRYQSDLASHPPTRFIPKAHTFTEWDEEDSTEDLSPKARPASVTTSPEKSYSDMQQNTDKEPLAAYQTLKTAFNKLSRENFDLRSQIDSLTQQLIRYKAKFGELQ